MMGRTEAEYRMPMPWDTDSPLTNVYKRLIELRSHSPALTRGGFATIEARDMLLHYARTWRKERIEIAVNPGAVPAACGVSGEILLQKNHSCDLLEPNGYVVTRSVLHGEHDL